MSEQITSITEKNMQYWSITIGKQRLYFRYTEHLYHCGNAL